MQCDLPNCSLLCDSISLTDKSVRYGRVPKRSRELNGTQSSSTSTADINEYQTLRVSTPGTLQIPQMCSIASSPSELSCTSVAASTTNISTLSPLHSHTNCIEVDVGQGSGQSSGATELTVYDVILCISQAHRANCTYTEEMTRDLNGRTISLNMQSGIGQNTSDEMASNLNETFEFQKAWLWQQFANRVTPGVQRVVEFAKRVPGFCDFTQDDQLILVKLGFFEIWLTHIARLINDQTITFDDGTCLTRQQLELLYDSDFVCLIINFANTLNSYNLSDPEIGLFSALVLLATDRSGLSEHKAISRARERISEALRVQIVRTRPGSTQALQLMPALEAKIPELRSIGTKHFLHLDWLRVNWKQTSLPPLFAEIFDIPKYEDDL